MGELKKRVVSFVLLVVMLVPTIISLKEPIMVKAEEDTTTSIFTDYIPTIYEVIDESGFKHPGVGLTKDILENLILQVRAKKEPWYSYFNAMAGYYSANRNVVSANQNSGDWTKPASDAFNSQGFNGRFRTDGIRAYTQALMYIITGDEAYRANAMRIIRIWSQMDPAKYAVFNDAHIHTGIPLYRMVTAAEILRYSSCITERYH